MPKVYPLPPPPSDRLNHKYIIVRHGHSIGNAQAVILSNPEADAAASASGKPNGLDALGKQQAQATANAIAAAIERGALGTRGGQLAFKQVAVLTSPFFRAQQTATIINDTLTAQQKRFAEQAADFPKLATVVPDVTSSLCERNFGKLDGRSDYFYSIVWQRDKFEGDKVRHLMRHIIYKQNSAKMICPNAAAGPLLFSAVETVQAQKREELLRQRLLTGRTCSSGMPASRAPVDDAPPLDQDFLHRRFELDPADIIRLHEAKIKKEQDGAPPPAELAGMEKVALTELLDSVEPVHAVWDRVSRLIFRLEQHIKMPSLFILVTHGDVAQIVQAGIGGRTVYEHDNDEGSATGQVSATAKRLFVNNIYFHRDVPHMHPGEWRWLVPLPAPQAAAALTKHANVEAKEPNLPKPNEKNDTSEKIGEFRKRSGTADAIEAANREQDASDGRKLNKPCKKAARMLGKL